MDQDPDYTVLSDRELSTLDRELHVRRRGGATVKITLPLATYLGGWTDQAIRAALNRLPEPPNRDT